MTPGEPHDGSAPAGKAPGRLPETPTKHSAPPSPGVGTPGKLGGAHAASPGSAGFYRHDSDDPRPERIGPYRVVREIGAGGMGIVYLAVREDPQFQRRVALKVVRRGMDTAEVVRRFNLERQVLSALNHPNIASLLDGGVTDDGRPYFVMEYVEGEPITEHCDAHRLTVEERLALFRTVCAAVQFAHTNLIVHRDLKPANILITADGAPKLLDFGIAKLLNPSLAPGLIDPTATDLRLMTPEYASPEQARGDSITTASDVYTLGVLLYELLTGHRPYRLKSRVREEVVRAICDEEPEKPSTAVSRVEEIPTPAPEGVADQKPTTRTITPAEVSKAREIRPERLKRRLEGDLDNIVLMAMRKEPQRRYASAAQFAEDIGRHLENEPVIARPDRALYRATKFVRRNRGAVTAGALIGVALVSGTAVALWQAQRADTQRALAVAGRQQAIEQKAAADKEREKAEAAMRASIGLATLMEGFSRDLESFRSSTKRREALAESTLRNLQKIEANSDATPELKKSLASAYIRLGDLQGGIRGPSGGRTSAALASYERALRMLEGPPAPTDPLDSALLRITARKKLGDALEATDVDASLASQRGALSLAQAMLDSGDRSTAVRRALATAMLDVGDMLVKRGEASDAHALFERSLQLRRDLATEAADDDPNARRDLAIGLDRIVSARLSSNQPAAALPLVEESNRLREKNLVSEQDATAARAKRDLWNGLLTEAKCQAALGRSDAQVSTLRRAASLAQEMAAADPTDSRAARDVAVSFERLGDACNDADDPNAAAEAFKAMEIAVGRMRELGHQSIGSMEVSLGSRLGGVLLASGDAAGALARFEAAAAAADALAAADPKDIEVKGRNAAIMRQQVGYALRTLENWAGADAAYSKAAEAFAGMAAAAPDSKALAADVGQSATARGWVALDSGKPDEARRRFESAVRSLEPLGAETTASAEYRLAFADALAGLSICESMSGGGEEAESLARRAQGCANEPIAVVLRALSLALRAKGDSVGARRAAEECRALIADAPEGSPFGKLRQQVDDDLAKLRGQ